MRRSPLFNLPSASGPQRSSLFSTSFDSGSRRPDSNRGMLRLKQRSWAPSLSPQESMADLAADGGTLDNTHPSMLLIDEELRQQAERQAKRMRQLQARETRQRSVLADEASQEFDEILSRHTAYAQIAAMCASLHAARDARRAQAAQQSQQWSLQLIADAADALVREEAASRRALCHAEAAVRDTIAQLHVVEARGLAFNEGVFRLVHAEQVRRAFLLREEARGVEALGIPGFISLPFPALPASHSSSHDTKAEFRRAVRSMDKMDLMAAERCPFVCAADCPYMPMRTRQLGRLWASSHQGSPAPSDRYSAAPCRPSRSSVDEVGRQRVRSAMVKEHLRETDNFFPSLRI